MDTLHVPGLRQAPAETSTATSVAGEVAPVAGAPVSADLGWGRVLGVSAARMALMLLGCLVVWSIIPAVVGWTPRVILSGSMEPTIHIGDIVVTRHIDPAQLKEGQVITVKDPDHTDGRTRTHRLEERAEDGTLVTKGDNNPQPDSSHVTNADVLGIGVLRVPYVGLPAYWLSERNLAPVLGSALALSLLGMMACCPTRREVLAGEDADHANDGERDDDHHDDTPAPRTRGRRARQAAALAAATAVAVGTLSAPAEAAFKNAAGNTVSTWAAASSFYAYKSSVMGDSPSFYWRLGEASGSVVDDETSNSRDGALATASSSWGQAGALTSDSNTALKVSQAAITANTAVTGPSTFSVEAWVKTTSTAGGRILGFGNGSGQSASTTVDRQLYLGQNGKAYFGIGSAKTVVASTATINNGKWHHLVGTYTSGSNGMKLYVDGTLQGSTTATVVSMSGYWRAGAEGMSGWTSNPGQYFDGTLDELAVYPRVLSSTEVTDHYSAAN